jgi:hypothetical protein
MVQRSFCDIKDANGNRCLTENPDRFNITLRTSETVTEHLELCLEHWEKVRKALGLEPWEKPTS